MIDLIIFDCDGVLIDSEELVTKTWCKNLGEIGIKITEKEFAEKFTGISGKDKISYFKKINPEKITDKWGRDLYEKIDSGKAKLKLMKGLKRVLPELKKKMCIASGSNLRVLENLIKNTDLGKYINRRGLFTAAMVKNGKPAPDLFLYAAKAMGSKPKNCLVIEDSIAGVQAAKKAKMTVLGFTGASSSSRKDYSKKLLDAGADLVFSDMNGLPVILGMLSS